ncbi:MAG: MJ0042-type zinc finger domain-containing protein, partial [Alphaproteobacteria bacterium]
MILTCPACVTRYLVDPRSLGAAGRTVRCANCGHSWHQTPPADAPRRIDVAPPPGPETPVVRANLPALPPPQRPRTNYLPWTLALAIMVALVVVAHLGRDRIVEAWPPAAKLYAMLGVRVEAVGAGLEIRGIVTERRTA